MPKPRQKIDAHTQAQAQVHSMRGWPQENIIKFQEITNWKQKVFLI